MVKQCSNCMLSSGGGGESSGPDLPFGRVRAWGLVRWASCVGVWRFTDLWQPVGRHSRSGPSCDNSCKLVLEQAIGQGYRCNITIINLKVEF